MAYPNHAFVVQCHVYYPENGFVNTPLMLILGMARIIEPHEPDSILTMEQNHDLGNSRRNSSFSRRPGPLLPLFPKVGRNSWHKRRDVERSPQKLVGLG